MPAKRIGVLVVDDHPVVRQGFASILRTQPDLCLVADAATADEALAAFVHHEPDVTVLDLRLDGASGIDVAARIIAHRPQARIIVFTTFGCQDDIHEALKAGALSYLRKGSSLQEVIQAIRTTHAGQRYIPPEIAATLAARVEHDDLTAREHEVLVHLFEGRSNKEIAAALGLSDLTVRVHVKNVFNKLRVKTRTEAVTAALRKGILHLEP